MSEHVDPRIGRPLTDQHRERISATMTGVKKSEAHCRAISAGKLDKPLTAEQRQAISDARRGVPKTHEHRQAISNARNSAKLKSRAAALAFWSSR